MVDIILNFIAILLAQIVMLLFLYAMTGNLEVALLISLILMILQTKPFMKRFIQRNQMTQHNQIIKPNEKNYSMIENDFDKIDYNAFCYVCNYKLEQTDLFCSGCGIETRPVKLKFTTITQPAEKYVNVTEKVISGIDILSIDTIQKLGSDYEYKILSIYNREVKADGEGKIILSGFFRMSDTFDEKLRVNRRYLELYLLEADANTIIKSIKIFDHNDSITWHFKVLVLDKLKTFGTYRIAIGRNQAWAANWKIKYEFGDIRIKNV